MQIQKFKEVCGKVHIYVHKFGFFCFVLKLKYPVIFNSSFIVSVITLEWKEAQLQF